MEVAAGLSVDRELLTLQFEHFITPRQLLRDERRASLKSNSFYRNCFSNVQSFAELIKKKMVYEVGNCMTRYFSHHEGISKLTLWKLFFISVNKRLF